MANPIPVHIIVRGAYIFTKDLTDKQERMICSTFTIRNKNIRGYWDVIKCYEYRNVNGEICILIPRFGPLILQGKLPMELHNTIGPGILLAKETCATTAKFMGNQQIVYDELFTKYFNKKNLTLGMTGLILKLEAGQGKTFVGLHIIATLCFKTFIFTHNELVMNQWLKVFADYMPNIKVGQWYGKKKTDGDVIVGIINSALSYEKWGDIGLCIFDEAHLYCSKGRAEIFKKCQSTYMIGLSATPDERKEQQDNTYKVIQWHIGPILDAKKVKGYTEADIPFQGAVKMIKYRGHPDFIETQMNDKLAMTSNTKMIQQMTEDPFRIQLIVALVREMIAIPNTNLFIFAGRRSYLETIHNAIVSRNITCTPQFLTNETEHKQMVTIMGRAKREDVDHAEQHSTIILTTYQYFGTGKSIPRMNSVLLASPFKTGSKQIIPRIFRLGSDYSFVRQIYDIVDWSTTLKSQWYWRKKYYAEKQYTIVMQEEKWSDYQSSHPCN